MIMLKNALRNAPFCYISPIRVFEWLLIISCICAGKGMIFKMKNLGYYNGKFGPLEEMMVPMNDRVCYFGDGVYDATYSRNGVIFALDEHIDRFFNSAGLLRIELPCTKDEMKDILNDMVSKVDSGNNFVYWQATRGTGIRNHAFPKEGKANIWVTIKPAEVKDLSQRIKLITLEDTRFLHCNIKTLNLIPSVMAAQKTVPQTVVASINSLTRYF